MWNEIKLVNSLLYIERESKARSHTPEQRFRFRLKYSVPIINRLMKLLENIKFEDILTRFMNGEVADESFLPNHYVPRKAAVQTVA